MEEVLSSRDQLESEQAIVLTDPIHWVPSPDGRDPLRTHLPLGSILGSLVTHTWVSFHINSLHGFQVRCGSQALRSSKASNGPCSPCHFQGSLHSGRHLFCAGPRQEAKAMWTSPEELTVWVGYRAGEKKIPK